MIRAVTRQFLIFASGVGSMQIALVLAIRIGKLFVAVHPEHPYAVGFALGTLAALSPFALLIAVLWVERRL